MLLVFSACTNDQQENVNATYKIGLKYYNGQGVPKNNAEAMKYFNKAAEQGHADAQYILGRMYEYDVDIPGEQEAMNAQKNFTKKVDAGFEKPSDTKNYLVSMGNLMQNFNQIQAEAVKWYKKAASRLQSNIEKNMTSAQVAEGQRKAQILLNKIVSRYPGYKNEIKNMNNVN